MRSNKELIILPVEKPVDDGSQLDTIIPVLTGEGYSSEDATIVKSAAKPKDIQEVLDEVSESIQQNATDEDKKS